MESAEMFKWPETLAPVVLSYTAGYLDAVGFLKLGGIYVANMSGNSVSVGIHTAEAVWPVVLSRVWPLVGFVFGLFFARLMVDARLAFGRGAAPALLVEAGFLTAFLYSGSVNSGIFFASAAMGIQAATLMRFNGVTIYTCFVTGTLVKFAENLACVVLSIFKRGHVEQDRSLVFSLWFLVIWLSYVAGAVTGTEAFLKIAMRSVWAAVALLLSILIFDLFHPLTSSSSDRPKRS